MVHKLWASELPIDEECTPPLIAPTTHFDFGFLGFLLKYAARKKINESHPEVKTIETPFDETKLKVRVVE